MQKLPKIIHRPHISILTSSEVLPRVEMIFVDANMFFLSPLAELKLEQRPQDKETKR